MAPITKPPIAILFTFLIQGSALVWWVSARVQETHFIDRRVNKLEDVVHISGKLETQLLQRLARIEERLSAQGILLEKIDKRVR